MCSFLIGREKPGTQSEVARLISETLEQERNQQMQLEDLYEQSTEEVSNCTYPPSRGTSPCQPLPTITNQSHLAPYQPMLACSSPSVIPSMESAVNNLGFKMSIIQRTVALNRTSISQPLEMKFMISPTRDAGAVDAC